MPITLLLVDQSSSKIFFNGDESPEITPFTGCRYLYTFQRYSWSKSKVFLHRTEFLKFFALQNFKGAVPPKVVPALSPQPTGTSSGKAS